MKARRINKEIENDYNEQKIKKTKMFIEEE
jgi:hypothetical protein